VNDIATRRHPKGEPGLSPKTGSGSEGRYLDEAFKKEHDACSAVSAVANTAGQGFPPVPAHTEPAHLTHGPTEIAKLVGEKQIEQEEASSFRSRTRAGGSAQHLTSDHHLLAARTVEGGGGHGPAAPLVVARLGEEGGGRRR
jgi:hypothetical protein